MLGMANHRVDFACGLRICYAWFGTDLYVLFNQVALFLVIIFLFKTIRSCLSKPDHAEAKLTMPEPSDHAKASPTMPKVWLTIPIADLTILIADLTMPIANLTMPIAKLTMPIKSPITRERKLTQQLVDHFSLPSY